MFSRALLLAIAIIPSLIYIICIVGILGDGENNRKVSLIVLYCTHLYKNTKILNL